MPSLIDKLRSSPRMVLVAISFALFCDYYLYGMVAPLTAVSPAHIENESVISSLYGAYALGLLVATPILGIITDRIGRRKPMLLGLVLTACASALFGIGANQDMLFAARVLEGAGSACTWTAGLALVAEYFLVNRVQAMGIALLGGTTGSVLGPLVGGKLFDMGGYSAPFMLASALIALNAILLVLFVPRHKGTEANQPWKETWAELGGIVTDKSVLAAAFAVALAAASWAIMEPLFPMHLRKIGDASPAAIGALYTVSNLVYAFMAPVVAWVSDRLGVRHTIIGGLVLTAAIMPLLAVSPNIIVATIVLCLVSVAYAFTLNPTSAELGDAVDRRGSTSYAIAYAVYNLAYSLGMAATDSYVAFVTAPEHHLPLLHVLGVMSGLFLLCVPLFWFNKPRSAPLLVHIEAESETTQPIAPN